MLEVGCGRGDLARGLAARGHRVVAIDPSAPAGEPFRAVSLEDFDDSGPFDAVVAIRSLHHIHDLAGALEKIAGLLRPRGRLIVYEHAWERFDEPTARWYLRRRDDAGRDPAACLEAWRQDHAGLHDGATLSRELDRRFARRFFAATPYLHEELGGALADEEQALIDAGEIRALGFRYVGERAAAVAG